MNIFQKLGWGTKPTEPEVSTPAPSIPPEIPKAIAAPAAQESIMSFKSVLETVGADIKKVFSWVGSPAGQAVIKDAGAVVVAVDPALSGIVTLAENYITQAFTVESLAAGAGEQNGTGVQKLAAVVAAVTPTALAYAAQAGLPTPTAADIQNQANAIVAFLNAIPAAPAPVTA
jgi:hypothetical protein